MEKLDFNRNITRNSTNKRVEENISEIVATLISAGLSRADIAKHAGVSQTTVSTWENRGRADAATIDRLIESISLTQLKEPPIRNKKNEYSELWLHINAIKELGFNVSLTPIY